jgi:hypothetical protein
MHTAVALAAPLTVERSTGRVLDALDALAHLEPNKYALADWLNRAWRLALVLPHPGPFSVRMSTDVDVAIRAAQDQLATAREAACADGDRFLATLPDLVNVVRVYDSEGGKAFAPLDLPGATLGARGLSLLLAHYLTRPSDYSANGLLQQGHGVGKRDLVLRVLPQ